MVSRKDVFIRCGSIMLEGVLESPEGSGKRLKGAVICHPHPLLGGNMHNNVTRALKRGLVELGFACLRFNFRGTGRSEGQYDEGIAELEDVRSAPDFMEQAGNVDPERLLVAGYSFGCWVGLRAASTDPRPARLVGISPPLDSYDFSFLLAEKRPKLLVAGDRDFICPVQGFEALAARIPEPKEAVLLPAADHFFGGREDELIQAVDAFLGRYPFEDAER